MDAWKREKKAERKKMVSPKNCDTPKVNEKNFMLRSSSITSYLSNTSDMPGKRIAAIQRGDNAALTLTSDKPLRPAVSE